jgi:hypothetical protein
MAHTETAAFTNNDAGLAQDIFTNEYFNRFGLVGDRKELVNVLRSLEYVEDPHKFKKDIEEEIKECFNGIDYLVCFHPDSKTIDIYTSPEDIMMDSISQNGLKVVEKKYKEKPDSFQEKALEIWYKKLAEDYSEEDKPNYFRIYTDLKNGVNQVLSEAAPSLLQ